ncbi:hypothetical protein K4F52_010331 [Lecanicillium sp. MT-2017a]|nr:hypothetical protein K4F52_010331 [Lecanicillium sp. MT-2017a]
MEYPKAIKFAQQRQDNFNKIYSPPENGSGKEGGFDVAYDLIMNCICSSDWAGGAIILLTLSQPHLDQFFGAFPPNRHKKMLKLIYKTQNNPHYDPIGSFGKLLCDEEKCSTKGCSAVMQPWFRKRSKDGCGCAICERCSNDHYWAHQQCKTHDINTVVEALNKLGLDDGPEPTPVRSKKRKATEEGDPGRDEVPQESTADGEKESTKDRSPPSKKMKADENDVLGKDEATKESTDEDGRKSTEDDGPSGDKRATEDSLSDEESPSKKVKVEN